MASVLHEINGTALPKDPLVKRWTRDKIFERGDRREAYSGYQTYDMEFGILSTAEYDALYAHYNGQFITFKAFKPDDMETMTTYTGCIVRSVTGEYRDVSGWIFNPRMTIEVPI